MTGSFFFGIMLRLSLSLLFLILGALPAIAADGISRSRYLMGTVSQATAFGPAAEAAPALEAAFDEIARLESILSDYRGDSELSRLNRGAYPSPFVCSAELFDFIQASIAYSRATDGAFDITVAPLLDVWDLRGRGRLADERAVQAALRRVGSHRLDLDPQTRSVRFEIRGMGLDPGGIGKGYALDAAARVLEARGIRSGILDFGGQVLALRPPPGEASWQVGVAHPLERDVVAVTLRLAESSASTSGNAERGLTVNGRDLGHVLDPRTGMPVATARSVTVIARTATEADAISTALLVMNPEEGLRWLERRPDLAAVFLDVDAHGKLVVRSTPGLELNLNMGAARRGALDDGGRS